MKEILYQNCKKYPSNKSILNHPFMPQTNKKNIENQHQILSELTFEDSRKTIRELHDMCKGKKETDII